MKAACRRVFFLVAVALAWSVHPGYAGDFAVGAKASTLGAGVDLTMGFNSSLEARIGVQGFDYSGVSGSTSDVDYDVDLKLFSGIVTADWYPFGGSFRVSGGMVINGNTVEADGKMRSDGTYSLNGTTYTSSQLASLHGKLEYNSVAPYLGIGWGNPLGNGNWTLTFDLGAVFQGSPDISLTATGALANDPTLQANLEQERQKLKDELDKYDIYPVVSLGLNYAF